MSMGMAGHREVRGAVADGTADASICGACGEVSGGFVVAGHWPCDSARTLADPLAAALADPEGHALVQAIHDRKAGQ